MQRRTLLAAALLAGCAHAPAPRAVVRVAIDMRAEIAAGRFDPSRDTVGLRGAAAPLSWQHTLEAAPAPGRPGWWRVDLRLAEVPTQPLAYKFKIDSPGRAEEGWEAGRNRAVQLVAGEQTLERAFGSEAPPPPSRRSGTIERVPPRPSAHVAPREVQVWLPPGYDSEPTRRYPVLYLHDGQNVFDHEAAGAEWQVDEAAQQGVLTGALEPMLIVAVASGLTRVLDYTPLPMQRGTEVAGGGAAAYGRYLTEELKPWVDSRWRTRPGREDTAVGGSSLGGLVTMQLLLQHADAFSAGLVVSPSVWWAGQAILREVELKAGGQPPRIWLCMGTAEGAQAVQGARALRDTLAARGWPARYTEAAGEGHDEAAWARRVPAMLRFLYGRS